MGVGTGVDNPVHVKVEVVKLWNLTYTDRKRYTNKEEERRKKV